MNFTQMNNLESFLKSLIQNITINDLSMQYFFVSFLQQKKKKKNQG